MMLICCRTSVLCCKVVKDGAPKGAFLQALLECEKMRSLNSLLQTCSPNGTVETVHVVNVSCCWRVSDGIIFPAAGLADWCSFSRKLAYSGQDPFMQLGALLLCLLLQDGIAEVAASLAGQILRMLPTKVS